MNGRPLAFGILGLAAMAALFWTLKPAPAPTSQPVEPVPAAPMPSKPGPVAIEIRQGQRVAGPEVIQVSQGEDVELRITSDADAELHLHGYDLHLHLKAGAPKDWRFTAQHSGRFEFELHGAGGAHAALGVIEVAPK